MKKINLILLGSVAADSYTFAYIKVNGSDDSTQKAAITGFSKNLISQEEDADANVDVYGFNTLTSKSYLWQNLKYRFVSLIDSDSGSVQRSLEVDAVKKNGIDCDLVITITPLNLILATSIGENDKDTGNTLVYLPGIDDLASKDFNVYEVEMTPQELFTALKA